jgi:hypothetical protein
MRTTSFVTECELGISKITVTLHRADLHGCFCGFSRRSDNKDMLGM